MMWESIASDRSSGSEELALKVLDCCDTLLSRSVDYKAELVIAASVVLPAKPRMAVLYNLFNHLFLASAGRDSLLEAVSTYRQRLLDSRRLLCVKASEFLKTGHLLLHSYSSTVVSVLRELMRAGVRPKVTVTESRPVMEGRRTAAELAGLGFQVTLIADAAVATQLTSSTTVLLGADSITADSVDNKVGSYVIALAGRERGCKVYTVATSAKLLPVGVALPEEPAQDPAEVWDAQATGVQVWNRYFESTPLKLFSGVILESGCAEPAQVAEMLKSKSLAAEMRMWSRHENFYSDYRK